MSRERPTYATPLLAPFGELLEDYEDLGNLMEQMLSTVGERVLVEVAHRALEAAENFTKDPDLGLKASRRLVIGDVGTVDYVINAAATVREGMEQAARYIRLVNDVLEVRLEQDGVRATVRLENSIALPRAAADFEVGGFFRNHFYEWFRDRLSELTVWFTHAPPPDLTEYQRTFGEAAIRFNAPYLGFTFPQSFLDLPLPGADPNLSKVLVPFAQQSLDQLVATRTVTVDVRKLVAERLSVGGPEIADVASELGMGIRTLARRLESEGTSFRALVDDVRKQVALGLVGGRDVDFTEIAFRLGFAHPAAFHRAFRRWTGQTPLGYRRASGR